MARERSLLDRLRSPEPESSRTIHEDPRRLSESVIQNLRRLLNSRHGIVPTQLDYGIPDLCDVIHNFPDAIQGMRRAIKTTIEKYEPRLRRVSVKHLESADDPLALRYEITAELITEEGKSSIWIQTRIDRSGEVDVRS